MKWLHFLMKWLRFFAFGEDDTEQSSEVIRIDLQATDLRLVEEFAQEIVSIAQQTRAVVDGPIAVEPFDRPESLSPHDRPELECRRIEIRNPTVQTVKSLNDLRPSIVKSEIEVDVSVLRDVNDAQAT